MKHNIIICVHEDKAIRALIDEHKYLMPHVEDLAKAAGDYIVGNWILERKTVSDFIGSITSGRIFEQARKLQSMPDDFRVAYILEGSMPSYGKRYHSLPPNRIMGVINQLLYAYNIPCFRTSSKKQTVALLAKLARLEEVGNYDLARAKRTCRKTMNERQEFFMQGLPGVGPLTARKWLKESGSVWACMDQIVKNTEGSVFKNRLRARILKLFKHRYGTED